VKPRDREVLADLHYATREATYRREWVRPLDVGGSGHNDVAYRLNKLARLGLVEWKQRWGSEIGGSARAAGMSRGSKEYRLTEAGAAALASE